MLGAALSSRGAWLCLGLLLSTATGAQAQVRGGIKGGYNSANVSLKVADDKVDTRARGGFHVGGTIYVGSPTWGIEVQGLYTQKGFRRDEDSPVPFDEEWHFNYWEFPVLLMAQTPMAVTSPRVFFGPTLGFQTSCKRTVFEEPSEVELDCVSSEVNTTDIGFLAGIGIKATSLTIDVSYEWGFKDIARSELINLKNRNLMISVGLTFPN